MQLIEDNYIADKLNNMPTLRPAKKRIRPTSDADIQQQQPTTTTTITEGIISNLNDQDVKRFKENDSEKFLEVHPVEPESTESLASMRLNRISDIDNEIKSSTPEEKSTTSDVNCKSMYANNRVKLEQNESQVITKLETCDDCSVTNNLSMNSDGPMTVMTDDDVSTDDLASHSPDDPTSPITTPDLIPANSINFIPPPSPCEPVDDDLELPSLLNLSNGHIVKLETRTTPTKSFNSFRQKRQPQRYQSQSDLGARDMKSQLMVRTSCLSMKMATHIDNAYSDTRTELSTLNSSTRLTDIAPPSPPLEDEDRLDRNVHKQDSTNVNGNTSSANMDSLISLINIIRNGSYEEFVDILHGKLINKYMLNLFVDGQTALHYSLMYGRNLAWCKELVSCGSNPDLMNQDGWHPIHLAAYSGLHETMLYLIDLNDSH